jgi:hypothetical protein
MRMAKMQLNKKKTLHYASQVHNETTVIRNQSKSLSRPPLRTLRYQCKKQFIHTLMYLRGVPQPLAAAIDHPPAQLPAAAIQ